MMAGSLLSLVVATVGRTTEVTRLLQTLLVQSDRRFEVLIVDQNPDNRLVAAVRDAESRGLAVQHLRLSEPNLSLARNTGLRAAQGEFIAFPDDDCWYDADAIAKILQAFGRSADVQGVVACWQEQSLAAGRMPERKPLSLPAWRKFRDGDASSITLFFRRALFDRVGGFDERFGVGQWFGAGEEIDFVLRALAAGALIEREPGALVHHVFDRRHGGDLSRVCRNARQRARGLGGLYAKHRLDAYVIVRGFGAPMLLTLFRQPKPFALIVSAAMCIGRVEGYLRYRLLGLPRESTSPLVQAP